MRRELPGSARSLADELAAALDAVGAERPEVGLVLGSGLGGFADSIDDARVISFADLSSMPGSTVPGHSGRFVAGRVGGVPVLCQQGRVHLYEGWSAEVVTRVVRALPSLGARGLLLTNAAGGLVVDWPVPCLMAIEDHINMQGDGPPMQRSAAGVGRIYGACALGALRQASESTGVALRSGVYVGLRGPTYESPAEIRMLQGIGAHAVGMSTVLEASAARLAGLEVGAVSCITNPGAGLAAAPLDHGEVVEAGKAVAADFARLLGAAVPTLQGELAPRPD